MDHQSIIIGKTLTSIITSQIKASFPKLNQTKSFSIVNTFTRTEFLTFPDASLTLLLNSFPSRMRLLSPGLRIPHLLAMERAVLILSPVTIRTVMPARWHFRMASGTSGRTGSSMPTIQRQVMLLMMLSSSSQLGSESKCTWKTQFTYKYMKMQKILILQKISIYSFANVYICYFFILLSIYSSKQITLLLTWLISAFPVTKSLYATEIVRRPLHAIGSITSLTSRSCIDLVKFSNLPSLPWMKEHL